MTKPLPIDVRERVASVVDAGMLWRGAAERLRVGGTSGVRVVRAASDLSDPFFAESKISVEFIHAACLIGGRQACRRGCHSISVSGSLPPWRLAQRIAKLANVLELAQQASAADGRESGKTMNLAPRP